MVDYSQKAANALLESLQLSREANDRAFERVRESIDALTQQITLQSQNIGRLEAALEKTNGAIERLTNAVDSHLGLARQQNETAKMQAANISDLTRLVATQAETVNRLLERVTAA